MKRAFSDLVGKNLAMQGKKDYQEKLYIKNANKVMLMAGMAYNLKKYLKFSKNEVETVANQVRNTLSLLFGHISPRLRLSKLLNFSIHYT